MPTQRDWWLLIALIVFQAALYHTAFVRELAWHYPENFDQAGALFESYDLEVHALTNGLGEFWGEMMSSRHMNGLLLPVEGAVSGLIFGGARLSRLAVNFAGLVALEVAIFSTVFRLWHRRDLAFIAIGLILCLRTPWSDTGGLLDFRIDFMTCCLFGIWIALALRSDTFLGRRGAIACGVTAATLILHRFIAVIPIAGVSVGLAFVCLGVAWIRRRDAEIVHRLLTRFSHVLLSSVIAAIIAGPFLYRNFPSIYAYYGIGHIVGDERLFRAHEQGLTSVMDHLLYYPRSIIITHLGASFLIASALLLATLFVLRRKPPVAVGDESEILRFLFCLGGIVGPVVALTCDISKSPVVGGIVAVPAVLIAVLLAGWWGLPKPGRLASRVLMATIMALGLGQTLTQATRPHPTMALRDELEQMAQLDLWMMRVAQENHYYKPRLSMDRLHPAFTDSAITDTILERTGLLMQFRTELSNRVTRFDAAEMRRQLEVSDIVILTSTPKPCLYPFNDSIRENWGELNAWVANNMVLARHETFSDFNADIHIRPGIHVSGLSGGWILDQGMWLEGERRILQQFPVIRMLAPIAPQQLSSDVIWTAIVETTSGTEEVPVDFDRNSSGSRLTVDLTTIASRLAEHVRINVRANRSFVPAALGINSDTRSLVLQEPTSFKLYHTRRNGETP